MKEEKYYTPQLEEFGIGFEFEYQNKMGRWVRMKMDRLDFRVEPTMTLQYSLSLHKERFRVKYLDASDAMSMGYSKIDNDEDIYEDKRGLRIYISNDRYVNILIPKGSSICGEGMYRALFIGRLKNKSELIKILKMIGL